MTPKFDLRRYLVDVDSRATSQVFTDCLVVGGGIAGLRAALEAAKNCGVILVCKSTLDDSNTWLAQGGIASVLKEGDSFKSHIEDTLQTGCGLSDEKVVEYVVKQGPELIKELLEWGADFDKKDGELISSLEGGHSHNRIFHAHGDKTGQEIADTLITKARQNPNIRIIENFYTIDLITDDDQICKGIIGRNERGSMIFWATNTILATGGAGRLYRETTNPKVATADGLAMAYRAGAALEDLEMMQFHPTTLYIAGASRALVSEAVRGEGGKLVDSSGHQFMEDYHEQAELAPRDIVSRAILSQMLKTNSTHVYLDVRHFEKDFFTKRFPTINEMLDSFDIDPTRELIPVRPSAHYMIGGIKTDINAKTNIENLFACGEAACTNLHGANRLASNSLLEGLVFGKTAGLAASESTEEITTAKFPKIKYTVPASDRTRLDTVDVYNSLRALMWRNVGITRREKPLKEAQEIISFWHRYVLDKNFDSPDGWECQNMLITSLLMAFAAEERKESRGVHYRQDYPQTDDENFKRHIEIKK